LGMLNKKMKNWAKKGRGLGHVTYFCIFCHPLPLLSTVRMKLQTSNFAAGSRVGNAKQKMKNWAKRAWPRSRDLLMNFGIPYYLRSGWSYKRTFAAGSWAWNTKQKMKNWAKRAWPRSRDLLKNFGIPYYLRSGWNYKRTYAAGSWAWNTKQKMKNWPKRGVA